MPEKLGVSIVLLGAVWASVSQYLNALKILQSRKDLVLDISKDGIGLTAKQKAFIMKNDFIPLWGGSVVYLMLMAVMIYFSQSIADARRLYLAQHEKVLLFVIAFVVFATALTVLVCGIKDIAYMKKHIQTISK